MADSHFPTLVSRTRDANAANNVIFTQLSDGTSAIDVTAGALDVNVDNTVTVTVSGSVTVTATQLDIDDLVHTTDSVAIGDGTDLLAINADGSLNITDNGGSITVDGSVTTTVQSDHVDDSAFTIATDYVSGMGALADETTPDSVDEGDIGLVRMTLDRKLLTRVVGATDANRLDIDASGHAQVDLAAVSVTAVPVSATTAANTEVNPIFVQVVSGATSGNEIHDYDTQAALASDTPDNHDYTVAGTTFMLKSIIAAASGAMKLEVQTGPVASLATVAVGFIPKHGGHTQLFFDPPVEVPVTSTGTVRVIRTNREGAAQDVYSTIIGYDL